MNLDLISERDWLAVITGKRQVQFEFLALQLFLANLRHRLQTQAITVPDCIAELKTFYAKFSRLPMAEKDFAKIANHGPSPGGQLLPVEAVAERILAGQSLILAGAEELLGKLPSGNWIGGTTPYFVAEAGGCLCQDKIFVTELPGDCRAAVRVYAEADIGHIYEGTEAGEISFLILPADSRAHLEFALHAPCYAGFALHPLVGWVAGIDLALAGQATPKVFCGGPQALGDAAAVMRIKPPGDCLAQIKIINLFQPGDGPDIKFSASGLSATTAEIDGREQNFAEYLERIQADQRLPLVANYYGAMVNVSVKHVDPQLGLVQFYAPVVAGIAYKLARPIGDYVAEFEARLQELPPGNVLFACNCILNYLHSKLENKRISLHGPVTFGEIAFQLLNQTLVYVEWVKSGVSAPGLTTSELDAAMVQLAAAHEELRASEHRFRMMSESLPLGVFVTDANGTPLYENHFCRQLTGISDDDGRSWADGLHPDDRSAVLAELTECQRTQRDFHREYRFLHPDGRICWVHSQTAFLRSEAGEITGRVGVVQDITGRRQGEIELERVNRELLTASREAGMAEVTNGVLHNVKNVINSINVSASVIADRMQKSKASSLSKVTALLREHTGDLGSFLTEDAKGKLIPGYLDLLANELVAERGALLKELQQFEQNVEHIKKIVTMQQAFAKGSALAEKTSPRELMEDSLRFNAAALARHGVEVVREYAPNLPDIVVEKHRVLQILVNFIRNAKEACEGVERTDRRLVLRATNGGEFVNFAVTDNGTGIAPENIKRIFEHGFTTKKSGHGFGLHSCVLTARELGGEIQMHSDGVGTGATFTLRLPVSQLAMAPIAANGHQAVETFNMPKLGLPSHSTPNVQ